MSGKKNNKELPKWYDGAIYTEQETVTNPFTKNQLPQVWQALESTYNGAPQECMRFLALH